MVLKGTGGCCPEQGNGGPPGTRVDMGVRKRSSSIQIGGLWVGYGQGRHVGGMELD